VVESGISSCLERADLLTTNVHIWPLVERARDRGAKLVVIGPAGSKTAERATAPPGECRHRRGAGLGSCTSSRATAFVTAAISGAETVGFAKVESEVLQRFGSAPRVGHHRRGVEDLERFAHMYARARAPFIRLGEGMSRCVNGGQAIRAVALLPA